MTFLLKPSDELSFEDEAEDPMALGGLGMSIRGGTAVDTDEDEDEENPEEAAASSDEDEDEEELDDLKRLDRLEREVKIDEPEIDLGENDDGDAM